MELKFLNDKTIKLTLSLKDMKKYNLNNESLKNNKTISKNLILNILQDSKKNITFKLNKTDLFLNSLKIKNNKCTLYISIPLIKNNTITKIAKIKKTNPIIAVFEKEKNMKNFCKNISYIFFKTKFESELYSFENKFILTVFVQKDDIEKFIAIVKEFGDIYSKSKIQYGTIKEHCKVILKKQAIEKIISNKS